MWCTACLRSTRSTEQAVCLLAHARPVWRMTELEAGPRRSRTRGRQGGLVAGWSEGRMKRSRLEWKQFEAGAGQSGRRSEQEHWSPDRR